VYFDRNAFSDATLLIVTDPLVYFFTCREIVINGFVPKGMSFIFHGFNLNFVYIVASDFIPITSGDLVKSFSFAFTIW